MSLEAAQSRWQQRYGHLPMEERKKVISQDVDNALAYLIDAGSQPTTEPKIKMVCSNCGSENVTRDGLLKWSVPDQQWEASAELDNTQCDDCGSENCLEERNVE